MFLRPFADALDGDPQQTSGEESVVRLLSITMGSAVEGVSRDTVILRLGPRASRGIRPPPVYIALRFRPATLTALWGRGGPDRRLGVRSRSRLSPVHVPRPPVLAEARDRTIPTG